MQAARALAVGLALLLAGCPAVPRREPPVEPWETRRTELQALERFELRGRVAVAAAGEGFNARLRWEQAGPRTRVALDGPLGVGGVQVTSDGSGITVVTSRGAVLDSDAARTELESRLGFEPPLGSLRYWILGVPDPALPADETLDERQRLAALEQDGWRIEYQAYEPLAGEWLPTRMTLRREDVRVRLIVDDWTA